MKINLTRLLEFSNIGCPKETTGDWEFDVGSRTDNQKTYAFELDNPND